MLQFEFHCYELNFLYHKLIQMLSFQRTADMCDCDIDILELWSVALRKQLTFV